MPTLFDLHKNPSPLRIGDIAFFESVIHDMATLDISGKWLLAQDWFKPLLDGKTFPDDPDSEGRGGFIGMACKDILKHALTESRERGANPDWLEFLPLELRRYLEYRWLTEEADAYRNSGTIPHAGFGFTVFENGLVEDADNALELGRLSGIRQLASLHGPIVTEESWREYPMDFTHTRYSHSLDVCAMATLIGQRCGLSEHDFVTLRVAAQSHDALTPAGGDSLKAIDPGAFDEDAHYPEIFLRPGWPKLRGKYGLQQDELAKIILGNGLLGRILDASDKLAYTGYDTAQFLSQNPPNGFAADNFTTTYDRIVELLKANPYPCSVWECAEQKNGELVFTDAERFADFLRLRALMFKILYSNAAARFMEAGLVAEVAGILYQNKILTREKLLSMWDFQLFEIMGHAMGTDGSRVMSIMPTSEDPRVKTFRTFKESLAFEREIATNEPETMTHFEVAPKPSVGCHKKFKVVCCGKVLPFDRACPFHDWDIKQIFHDQMPYRVFIYNLANICPNKRMKKRLLESRNKRIAS
jgi:hypothetical protein